MAWWCACALQAIDVQRELLPGTGDGEYLEAVVSALRQAFSEFQPDLLIYNAGTDILEGELGQAAQCWPGFSRVQPRGANKAAFLHGTSCDQLPASHAGR